MAPRKVSMRMGNPMAALAAQGARHPQRRLRCWSGQRGLALGVWLLICWLGLPGLARAQDLSLQLESDDIYANLPFVLQVVARGFDENPAPSLSKLVIPGCRVTSLGVTPQVASMTQIINGQRTDHRQVTFLFRFRIEAGSSGAHTVPPLTATQGDKRASSPQARFMVKTLDETNNMQLRLVLPDRPLWVGETVDAAFDWYVRGDVGRPSFSLPLFDQEEWLEIDAPPAPPAVQRLRGIQSGSRQLELPYEQGKATLDGVEYNRFRIQFRMTANKPGTLLPPPARVMAEVQVGYGRDLFGFQVPQSRLFQALAKPARVEIRPLPQANRPASFKNAVGSAFAIEVQAGRTVVRVGDPIELRVLLRGKGRLAGLILPDVAAMGLAPTQFSAPEEPPSGEVTEDGKAKLFRLAVRLRSQDVREIPTLSFSYFDPELGRYQTVQSQPIALSVKGSAVVAAGDVVAPPTGGSAGPAAAPGRPAESAATGQSLVGADLALSDEGQTLHAAPTLAKLRPLVFGLYVVAGLLVGLRFLLSRRQQRWQVAAERHEALARLQAELDRAASEPARDVAPRLATSLRALRRQLGLPPDAGRALIERLETESYAPDAAGRPLSATLRSELTNLLAGWSKLPAPTGGPSAGPALRTWLLWALSSGLVTAGIAYSSVVQAQDAAPGGALVRARSAYQAALAQSDRDRRLAGFAQAEALFAQLAGQHPDCPELLTDWGNAALLAQEPGRAIRAYRLALREDPSLQRARRNLTFVRDRLPDWLPRPRGGDGFAPWLQLSGRLASPLRHVVLATTVLVLSLLWLLERWLVLRPRRRQGPAAGPDASSVPAVPATRLLGILGLATLILGLLTFLSLLDEPSPSREAVVLHGGAVLRSADSSGAPPSFAHPLPAGAEVRIDEARGSHTRVTLADGQSGWLLSSTLMALRP